MPFNEKNVYTGRARMRARDIREALKDHNIDPALIHTLEGLADNDKTSRDQIEALAELVDKCIDQTNMLVAVLEQIKNKFPDIDKLKDLTNVLNDPARRAVIDVAQDAIKLKDPDQT